MPAVSPGNMWAPIWQEGVWKNGLWAGGTFVSPGKIWGSIWAPGVWRNRIWRQVGSITETLLPELTVTNVGWTVFGAPTVHEALKDGSDSSYVQGNAVPQTFTVKFAPPTETFASVTAFTINFRAKRV